MSDNYNIQISPVLPDGTMVNVRASDPGQFSSLLDFLEAQSARIVGVVQTLKTVGQVPALAQMTSTVQDVTPAQPAVQGWGQPAPPAQPAPAPNQGPVPTCQHGPRKHRSGEGKKGPWQAWFCPTPKGTPGQCDTIFF